MRRYYFKLSDYEEARGSHTHEWIARHVLGVSRRTWQRRLTAAKETGYLEVGKLEADALRADLRISTVNPLSGVVDHDLETRPIRQVDQRSIEDDIADLQDGQEILARQISALMKRLDERIDGPKSLEARLGRLEAALASLRAHQDGRSAR